MKVIKLLTLFLVTGFMSLVVSCGTEQDTFDEAAQYAEDLEAIDQYITDNNITDTLHHWTDIRYKVHTEGTGLQARVGDFILVDYKGYFLDGEVFDQGLFGNSPPVVLNSSSMILGWYYMCQDMQEGDSITIYLPSAYAYGRQGQSAVPPNTPLIFDMKMIRVGE